MDSEIEIVTEKYSLEISEKHEHAEWDQFLASCGLMGHHEQTSCWAAVMRPIGWRSVRIILRREGRITGGGQVLIKPKRMLGPIMYVRWGPCFAEDDPVARGIWVDKLCHWAKRLGTTYLIVNPNCTQNDALVPFLRHKGFMPKKEKLPPWNLTEATLLVELSKPLDVLFSEMRYDWRRHVRLGIKSGLVFREGEETDLPAFFELMKCTAERRGESPNPGSVLFFQRLWQAFQPSGWVKLLLVEKSNKLISAAFIFPFGNTARFWKFGWSGEYHKLGPNKFLYWNLIKYSKEHGYKFLDIVQVEPDIAEALRKKKPVTDQQKKHSLYGATFFKMGIGGKIFHYPGAYYLFVNPLWRQLFEFVIHPLTKRPLIKKFYHRLL